MWTSDRGRSFLALGIFCALVVAADAAFAVFARGHYLPARKLEAALASRSADVVIAGDSRMVAALDVSAFRFGWQECGHPLPTVADLSLGGLDIAGQVVAARRFFERGGSARFLVLGTVPETLAYEPTSPEAWIGNEAIVLWWSHLSDARLHFPPSVVEPTPVALDGLFQFASYRLASLASLRSLLWVRAQQAQDRILGRARNSEETNSDMRVLGQRFVQRGLLAARRGPREWQMSPWLCELRATAERYHAALSVVELPMPETYRPVRESEVGKWLRDSLPHDFCGAKVTWIDLSEVLSHEEAKFPDGLHLAGTSASALSRRLGCELATTAAPSP
jgi:hypothetical protein